MGFILVIVFVFLIIQMAKSESPIEFESEKEARRLQEKEIKARDEAWKIQESIRKAMEDLKKDVNSYEERMNKCQKKFFEEGNRGQYDNFLKDMRALLYITENVVSETKQKNEQTADESIRAERREEISKIECHVIPKMKHTVESIEEFKKKVYLLPDSKMIDTTVYGKANKEYWRQVQTQTRENVIKYIKNCKDILNNGQIDYICKIDVNFILNCVWYLASEKTSLASEFQEAKELFYRIYRKDHIDVIIADLFVKKKMGGENILREKVRELLENNTNHEFFKLIASSLMWMNAYESESMVLQHMFASEMEMTVKMQERLRALLNEGGNTPMGFEVENSNQKLYFDISALAWKEEQYVNFFENLAFQDKKLTYSLAVREEDTNLVIAQGIMVPNNKDILEKFKMVLKEEYGTGVKAQIVQCIILAESGEEEFEGVLVSSEECEQMGVLIYVVKIGKKLIIKFYTLFRPTDEELSLQRMKVISMYKNYGPVVAMWESSLKTTMLMAIEQLLNARGIPEHKDVEEKEIPIF